jgi:hypothetical protein
VLGSCLFTALSAPLEAGEYGGRYVWYSANCCYQKAVRHERDVRYVPVDRYARPYIYENSPRVCAPQPGRHCTVQQSAFNYAY